ncbi:MAG TPA: ABC transporter ATP-binding protein [Chloroflexota bacterium]|nr:ABC transporter ATP-binding protein [Chloroflexota bacterium]
MAETRMPETSPAPLLEARGLTRHFQVGGMFSRRTLHAVDDVDLVIQPREIVTLVGESGSGKSTVARLLAGLFRPTAGDIRFHGRPLATMRGRRSMLEYRRRVQMVFQDPYSSLNPVYPAAHGIFRALKLHRPNLRRQDRRAEAERILDSVGLTPSREFLRKYPYELSGGQRQRFGFAQALASRPELILADEPVSMLDVSIRIGVLNLMAQSRERDNVSLLYITHDIASARYISDRLLVMYAGRVVERGPVEDVLAHPKHPYTELLLSAIPDPYAPAEVQAAPDAGEPPRVIDPEPGCRFRWRCPYAVAECARIDPPLRRLRPDHDAACIVATADEVAVGLGDRA